MLDGELGFQKRPKRNWNIVYYSQVQEEVHSMPPGATQVGPGRMHTESAAEPRVHAFIRVCR